MALNKLNNFIRNTEGRLLYVNPNDINSTDSITNDGTSLTTPFKTIQRALLEASRFSYVGGLNNDIVEKTTILLFPGEHLIDNRPGWAIYDNGGTATARNRSGIDSIASTIFSLELDSVFDLTEEDNILYKFNSYYGGVIVPRGTSIVGLDLRKTKIRPKYVPNPTDNTGNSAIFRITGACYFWQFSIFDADTNSFVYTQSDDFSSTRRSTPTFSHHKLTCFEFCDGVNQIGNFNLTDLDMYYSKVSNAYNSYRSIDEKFPGDSDGFAKRNPEWEIVGVLVSDPISISSISLSGSTVTVTTSTPHKLNQNTPIKIKGVSQSGFNVSTIVNNVISSTIFTYLLTNVSGLSASPTASGATVTVETDTVSGASPYIFNCSLRSVWGMNGLHADGSKASGFKSTVVAQFTAVSLQKDDRAFVKYDKENRVYDGVTIVPSTGSQLTAGSAQTISERVYHLDPDAIYRRGWESSHIKTSNDAFIQIVSVFAIGFNKHFDVESGGDASITNSNSNFGQISLNSSGFRKAAFDKDNKGYITSIVTPREINNTEEIVRWLPLDVQLTSDVGISSHLYLYGYDSIGNPPPAQVQGYKIGGKVNDKIHLKKFSDVYSASVFMCDNEISSSGFTTALGSTSSFKSNIVTSGPTTNSLTIGENSLLTGEKIKIISDNGDLPENVDPHETYYVIKDSPTATEIKISKSFTGALNGEELSIYGGSNLRILSRVSEKLPGEAGSPIQFDAENNNWFIHTNPDNEIYSAFINGGAEEFGTASSLVYVTRTIDERSLDEKLYKFRLVIPKELQNARTPESGFILQESSTTGFRTDADSTRTVLGSQDYDYNRNPRFISTCSTDSTTVTVLTELPHNLQVNDIVIIRNVRSSLNTTGQYNVGYNGEFEVTAVTDDFTFQYSTTDTSGNLHTTGTFTSNVNSRTTDLPRFERNDLQSNLYIYRNEVISPYVYNQQDGIYHLYVLNASNKVLTEFTNLEYSQSPTDLYPQLDRDNVNTNPPSSKTFAKRFPVGEVVTNDLKNSITRETVDIALQKLGVGLTISSVSSTATSATITFSRNHGLAGIVTGSITASGSTYTNGTFYGVKLLKNSSDPTVGIWSGTTAKVIVSGQEVTSVDIMSPGSGCATGEYLFDRTRIGTGDDLARYTVSAAGLSTSIGNVIQFTGVGTTSDGYYRVTSVVSSRAVSIAKTSGDPTILTSQYGIIIRPSVTVSSSTYDSTTGITIFNTSTAHGLHAGSKFKIINATNNNLGSYVVSEKISINSFNALTNTGVSTNAVYVLPQGLESNNATIDSVNENFGSRNLAFYDNDTLTLTNNLITGASISVSSSGIGTAQRLPLGSYIQIDNEIMRIVSSNNTTSATVIRGSLGTKPENHDAGSLIRKISPIAVELRRPSILRASGHTFEYLGYGPGNYSTSLPQVQIKTLPERETFLAQSQERSGGVVVYSGMNNNGDIFNGNTKTSSSSGETVSFDIPIPTVTGEDSGNLSSVFDKVTIKKGLFVEGGSTGSVLSQFDGPVTFNSQVKGTSKASFNIVEAETYENFKLSDLPTVEEETFAPQRLLKTKGDRSGYELIDIIDLDLFRVKSYGINGDDTVYNGTAENVNARLRISEIPTTTFSVGEQVKVFGISSITESLVPDLNWGASSATKVGTSNTVSVYRYWLAQYHLRKGTVGVSSQISPTEGIGMVGVGDFNDENNIVISLPTVASQDYGILVYRQISNVGIVTNINEAKLIAILGPKELSDPSWVDYGTYDKPSMVGKPSWSTKGEVNEFTDEIQIHFPNIATTGHRRGWAIDTIVSIGQSSLTLSGQYNTNTSSNAVKIVHDNTYGFSKLIGVAITNGIKSIEIPSGTFLTNKIILPNDFTLRGNGKNSVIKMQYFATDITDGVGNFLTLDGNVVGLGTTNASNITIQELTIDGNNNNNILFNGEIPNYLVNLENISSSLIKDIEIRNSPGHGLYTYDSNRLSIENSSFVDGSISDRYPFEPLNAQESESLRVNDCLFENYPGPVDLSASTVVSTGGNIIRNCGTGLRIFATGKISTNDNIILGPADEWIPTPDIYDSDFNSVNITIDRETDFAGPLLLYLEDGNSKDLSSTKVSITAGIGTIVGQGTTNETLGDRFLNFNIPTQNAGDYGRQNGYVQLTLISDQTATLGLGSALGYNIIGTEYLDIPIGLSGTVGIESGVWNAGVGATQYTVTLSDPTQFTGFSTGQVVKLKEHSVSPDLSAYELIVEEKIIDGGFRKLRLVGFTTDSESDGGETGYISIRNIFTIAKGRVGVI